jgi:uncharacterized OB-fold protein
MGELPRDWGLPDVTPTNEAWFTTGALAIQHCDDCGALQHPPEEACHVCGGMAFSVEVLAPHGTIHSYTVVHYPANPALAESVPYTVVLVSLDDAPHIRVVGDIDGDVEIGMPVEAWWDEREADDGTIIRLPRWRTITASEDQQVR